VAGFPSTAPLISHDKSKAICHVVTSAPNHHLLSQGSWLVSLFSPCFLLRWSVSCRQSLCPKCLCSLVAQSIRQIVGLILIAVSSEPLPTSTRLRDSVPSGKPEDIVQIKSIHVIPDPPQPGQNLTVNFSGHVTETIKVSTKVYHHRLAFSYQSYHRKEHMPT
jgi:hypothetical protein